MIKAVIKFLSFPDFFCEYLRKWFDFSSLVAVVAVGRNEVPTVFRRCAAPEKIEIVRTEGNNSGELGRLGMAIFMWKKAGKKV